MGFGTGLVTVGPTKVKAFKSIIFIEGSPEVKIKNTPCYALGDNEFLSIYFVELITFILKTGFTGAY